MLVDGQYEQQLIKWATKYDGYKRLAGSPDQLWEVLKPVREEFERSGVIPEWAGIDLLRGWAFYLVRAHRHGGAWEPLCVEYPEFNAIVAAISNHPAARKSDRPPVPERS